MAIRICQWSRFQHFKDRRPIWIKLYRDLQHKREWRRLSGDAAKLLVDLWMMAADQDDSGVISSCIEDVSYDLRESAEKLRVLLQELVTQGFIEWDSAVISDRYQDVSLEKRREEIETERETTIAHARDGDFSTHEIDGGDGSDFIPATRRMSASQILQAWESRQPSPLAPGDRQKHRTVARRIADGHTAEEVALAFVGMGQLFPHSNGEPWDLFDLERKFAKATAKARDHPELRSAQRTVELLNLLEAG